jgi:hypothetical protein
MKAIGDAYLEKLATIETLKVEAEEYFEEHFIEPVSKYFDTMFGSNHQINKDKKISDDKVRVGNWSVKLDLPQSMIVKIKHNPIKGPIWFDIVTQKVCKLRLFTMLRRLFYASKTVTFGYDLKGNSSYDVESYPYYYSIKFNGAKWVSTLVYQVRGGERHLESIAGRDITDDITETTFYLNTDCLYCNN